MSIKCVCPECHLSFPLPAGSSSVRCPTCDAPVRVVAGSGRRRLVLALGGGLVLLWLGGGIAALLYFLHPGSSSAQPEPPPPTPPAPPSAAVVVATQLVVPPPTASTDPPPPPPPPPPTISAEQKKINAAIDKGLAYLKRQAKAGLDKPPSGASYFSKVPGVNTGTDALVGLTLLECGVPADDPLVERLAQSVREAGPKLSFTYALSLSILFLDRLGDDRDRDLIQSHALRLIAGQFGVGHWSYNCPVLSAADEKLLLAFLKEHPGDGTGERVKVSSFRLLYKRARPSEPRTPPARVPGGGFDNSNTQFGVLGLWVARRHNIPVQAALVQADRHFRATQQADGSWKYDTGQSFSNGAMTCAGLLALAMGHSLHAKDDGKPVKDAALEKGFAYLAKFIGPGTKTFDSSAALGPLPPAMKPDQSALLDGMSSQLLLYYLWSVERVAVVYDLKKIGGQDWYAWVSAAIVKAQKDDGSWNDGKLQPLLAGPVNTCFALLVLKRVNIVPDLTVEVKKAINLKDIAGTRD